jgi:hypothetical protein
VNGVLRANFMDVLGEKSSRQVYWTGKLNEETQGRFCHKSCHVWYLKPPNENSANVKSP